ncbi:similar to Saccharomyces cerevisiae YJL131C AIM23 Putative protein of unknown function [Maudiozyma saulgeensis]|uniref:Altered inheritance of mitochondria protein 23, mitochondrial n=1 Tax=Maudiozyma saulgeensis TaxID=1789683 RepID=A0A1X7RAZ1_9SACH|nr:similar to Saccharomyces cerevisiae YJL131C AIM23 Putative protein of unknown function [Kazachstania saulgeensis]
MERYVLYFNRFSKRSMFFRRSAIIVRSFNSNNKGTLESRDLLRDIISNRQAKTSSLRVNGVKNRNFTLARGTNHNGHFTKRNPNPNHNPNHNIKKKKRIVINWDSGTERAQEAANHTIKEVFKLNSKGNIRIFDKESHKIEQSNIRYYARGLDLNTLGMSIVDIETVDGETRIPLIKIVDSKTALKRYSDDMAKLKENELIEKGIIRKRFSDPSKSEDTLKHIKLSWKIREDDLLNQKAHEIEGLLQKGNKVNIYIDDNNNGTPKHWLDDFEKLLNPAVEEDSQAPARIPKRELKHRNEIMEQIKTLVNELSVTPVIEGDVTSKVIIRLSPKPSTKPNVDKQELKEERRRARQEKLEKRIQKKKERLGQE